MRIGGWLPRQGGLIKQGTGNPRAHDGGKICRKTPQEKLDEKLDIDDLHSAMVEFGSAYFVVSPELA